jgi:prophage regulatory protein
VEINSARESVNFHFYIGPPPPVIKTIENISKGFAMAQKLLRLRAVCERTGLSVTAIYLGIRQHSFPRAVPLGLRSVGWIEAEIDRWVDERIAERADPAKRRRGGPGRGHKGRQFAGAAS